MNKLCTFILLVIATLASAKTVNFENCHYPYTLLGTSKQQCEIREIEVEPCYIHPGRDVCNVNSNSTLLIHVHYTPRFNGNMTSSLYYLRENRELSLTKLKPACSPSSCPIASGVDAVSSIKWKVQEHILNENVPVKVKLWNENRDECCAMLYLRFVSYFSTS